MIDFDYPFNEKIQYKGKVFTLCLTFQRVLKVFKVNKSNIPSLFKAVKTVKILIPEHRLSLRECIKISPLILNYINRLTKGISTYRLPQNGEACISFEKDISAIYASFLQCYQIDLFENDIHYLKFLMLLSNIGKDTAIYKIAAIRQAEIPPINQYNKDYAERLHYLKAVYSLEEGLDNKINSSLKELFEWVKGQ